MSAVKLTLATVVLAAIGVGAGFLVQQKMNKPQAEQAQESNLLPAPVEALSSLPDISLPGVDGNTHSSAQFAGKVVILNFWATWCPPCRKEIPDFIKLQDELGGKGLQFVGIAIDDKQKVIDYSREAGINYPSLLGDVAEVEISRRLGNRFQGLPFSAIFDRQGKLVHVQSGELPAETIREKTSSLL